MSYALKESTQSNVNEHGGGLSTLSVPDGAANDSSIHRLSDGGIRRMGYLKKLKTMKKKFFVLREAALDKPATLEYYDTEKKYRSGVLPKRSVVVSGCFAVNPKEDCKHKHAITIFTVSDCFSVVCTGEREKLEWMKDLVELQKGICGEAPQGESLPPLSPSFDNVWNVDIQKRGLGEVKHILGHHRLCLLDRILHLVPLGKVVGDESYIFPLVKLRKVGHLANDIYFYLEVGRHACTGPGEFCMAAEDKISAKHIHEVISEAMRKGGGTEEAAHQTASGHRQRSNTQESGRPRPSSDNRRNTYEATRDKSRSNLYPENSGKQNGPTGSDSQERLRLSELKVQEYVVPEFARSTSTGEGNYCALERDKDDPYYTVDSSPKVPTSPDVPSPNYSAVSRLNDTSHPRTASRSEQRPALSLSIPEEPGDYIPLTMPAANSQVFPGAAVHHVDATSIATASGESGYFDMTYPTKPDTNKAPPIITSPLPSITSDKPVSDSANNYMMMAPGSAASSSGVSDSRRSTMSNSSYLSQRSQPSDLEQADTVGEVTYAIMEGPRTRGSSAWNNSNSSVNSSFGWERVNSISGVMRPDYRLEKVHAFMTLEDQDPQLRGTRAYSTGCQPTNSSTPFKPDPPPALLGKPDVHRIRAFSLGNHSLAATSSRSRRGLVESPSAGMVGSGVTSPLSLDFREDLGASTSDTQFSPVSHTSSHSIKSLDAKKSNESSSRAEDLMELTFRPRSGT